MDNFLDAIADTQGVYLKFENRPVFIPRCRLGLHLQLSRLEERIIKAESAADMAAGILLYLSLAGVPDAEPLSATEQIEFFLILRRLNAWQWVLPWLSAPPSQEPEILPYEYAGRQWAIWIHKIAWRYGWSRDQILNLWPEEAAAYVQEILVSEYYDLENQRALSEVSYRYDSGTKTSKYIPSPKPNWMVDNKPPESIRIHRSALPVGNVISLKDEDTVN